MPKSPKTPQSQSSLLSFFSKTPKQEGNSSPNTQSTPKRTKTPIQKRPIKQQIESQKPIQLDDSPEKIPPKRRRVILSSDDEEENEADSQSAANTPTTAKRFPLSPKTPMPKPSSAFNTPKTPASRVASRLNTPKTPKTPLRNANDQTSESLIDSFRFDEFAVDETPKKPHGDEPIGKPVENIDDDDAMPCPHLSLGFLKPDQIMDAQKRRPDDPDYDPKTLYVPESYLREQSPGHRQWWSLKSQHFDTILCFKVGKFYEMYHMDAVICVEKLGLVAMRGKYAHCGFPEMGYGRFADRLVNMGYKVARIEQTETPAQLEERCKREKVKDKVVRRELCRVTTAATRTYGVNECYDGEKGTNMGDPDASYLFAIREGKSSDENSLCRRYGICFVDCSVGQFFLCEFTDDLSFSTLRTLLAHNQPTQLLLERNNLSAPTLAIINSILGSVPMETLQPKREFRTANETLKALMDPDYFGSTVKLWPQVFMELVEDPSEPIPKAKSSQTLCLSALGAALFYLRRCLIDVDMITMRNFELYCPTTISGGAMKNLPKIDRWKGRRMILDGCALSSLHLLPPSDPLSRSRKDRAELDTDGRKFSLFHTINRTITPFGRRLLRQWICAPSCDPTVITQRQEAVEYLCDAETKQLTEFGVNILKSVPDLERLFQRIHTVGLKYRSTKHPDSRAQMFEANRYNGRKVRDLCATLDGLEQIQKLFRYFDKNFAEKSPQLLQQCLGAHSETMTADLMHFKEVVADREKILKEGRITPRPGMDAEYDQSLLRIKDCEADLEQYLRSQKKELRCSDLKYFGNGKNRYQLEVPEALASSLSSDYELKSKRAGFKRYRTEQLEALIAQLAEAEKDRDALNDDSTRRVFADFDERKDRWSCILESAAIFDCLLSLSRYVQSSSLEMCTPVFDFDSNTPSIEIRGGYHPSLADGGGILRDSTSTYIPNDTVLGGEVAPILLLTGPNMGGKSTLMRQIATLTVLAQIGSKVPATSMRLTPVDRIFCRIGASDCLAAGQSTFYMELNETNVILREASEHSLVVVDELGRGTSTHDGTAIAYAVLKYLVNDIKCRTLFSTHYHTLCSLMSANPGVTLGHMACLAEKDEETDDPSMENITFLYTLAAGPAPKSYGFYTAKMAGIPSDVIRRAYEASRMIDSAVITQELRDLKLGLQNGTLSDEELLRRIQKL